MVWCVLACGVVCASVWFGVVCCCVVLCDEVMCDVVAVVWYDGYDMVVCGVVTVVWCSTVCVVTLV